MIQLFTVPFWGGQNSGPLSHPDPSFCLFANALCMLYVLYDGQCSKKPLLVEPQDEPQDLDEPWDLHSVLGS